MFDVWNFLLMCYTKFSLYADGDLLPSCGRSQFACLCLCLTLRSSYVFFFFFCLCCYSFLYDLLCPSASASSMHRSLLPASSCVQNLTTVASICNCALSTNFRSRFKMVFVRTIFHYELALLWPVCCPFHSHFLCLVSTCSQFLHVILPKLVLVIFSVFIVLYLNVL